MFPSPGHKRLTGFYTIHIYDGKHEAIKGGQLPEINSVEVNMGNAFMILCHGLKHKPSE